MTARHAEPDKVVRRPADVCAELDIQPYVLKFWEGEFPQLGRRIGPKRVYGSAELQITREIRRLLQEEGLSLGDARGEIDRLFPPEEAPGGPGAQRPPEHASAPERPAADETLEQLRQARAELARAEERAAGLEGALARAQEARRELQQVKGKGPGSGQAELIASLRLDLEGERTRVVNLQSELHRSWDEAVPLRETKVRLEQELAELRQSTEEERAGFEAQLRELREQKAALEPPAARAAKLEVENAQLQQRVEDGARAVAEVTADRDRLKAAAVAERERLQRDMDAAQARAAAELGRVAAARDAADVKAAQLAGALGRIAELERQLSETTEWADAASRRAAELPDLQSRAGTLQHENAELGTRVDQLETQVAAFEQERAELQLRVRNAEESIATLDSLLSEAESERDGLRDRASTEIGAALEQVRRIALSAEHLVTSLVTGSVVPHRRAQSEDDAAADDQDTGEVQDTADDGATSAAPDAAPIAAEAPREPGQPALFDPQEHGDA